MARSRKQRHQFGREFGRYIISPTRCYHSRGSDDFELRYIVYYTWPSNYVTGTNSVAWSYEEIDSFIDYTDALLLYKQLTDKSPQLSLFNVESLQGKNK